MSKPGFERGRGAVAALARKDLPLRNFLDGLPRPVLEAALAAAPEEKFQQMYACLFDPAYARMTLATLARRFNVTLKELTEMFRDHQQMAGVARMMTHAPEVLEDVAIDAKSRQEVCPRCNGSGRESDANGTSSSVKCMQCKGAKYVRAAGDEASRKMMLDAMGLTGRRGPLVAQQFNWSGGAPSLEDMIATTDKLLKQGPVVEVEAEK